MGHYEFEPCLCAFIKRLFSYWYICMAPGETLLYSVPPSLLRELNPLRTTIDNLQDYSVHISSYLWSKVIKAETVISLDDP